MREILQITIKSPVLEVKVALSLNIILISWLIFDFDVSSIYWIAHIYLIKLQTHCIWKKKWCD